MNLASAQNNRQFLSCKNSTNPKHPLTFCRSKLKTTVKISVSNLNNSLVKDLQTTNNELKQLYHKSPGSDSESF